MSQQFEISVALLRSALVTRAARNPDRVAAFEAGTATTLPSSALMAVQAGIPKSLNLQPKGELARQLRVYDRTKTTGRKRLMGGSGKLPNSIRAWFTEGERAVLTVISAEIMRHGACTLPIIRIAERAGVGVRTVQYALATARGRSRRSPKGVFARPALIWVEYRRTQGRKNDPSKITIISKEWLSWLRFRPSESPDIGCTEVHTPSTPLASTTLLKSETENGAGSREVIVVCGEKESLPPTAMPLLTDHRYDT